jgi:hypothetical protein
MTRSGLRPFLANIGVLKSKSDPLKSPEHHMPPVVIHQQNGCIPWSTGYHEYKMSQVDKVLADSEMLAIFRQNGPLPAGYGWRLDERIIEYPWMYAHLSNRPTLLLDAGSTLNFPVILSKPLLIQKNCVIYTLAPESVYTSASVSYIYGDLRDTLLRDHWFDEITCISTLEHIGMDNTQYSQNSQFIQNNQADFLLVMKEFDRLLKPGGRLWFTVPYGKYQHMGWQQQFGPALLQQAIDAFGGEVTQQVFYKYNTDGWQVADAEACASCEYFDIHVSTEFDPDYAAAARAVACVELLKK